MNDKNLNTVLLGALLHDIGKFIQRSDKRFKRKYKHQELSSIFCSSYDREGNKLFEKGLFEKYKNIENELLNLIVANHHYEQIEKEPGSEKLIYETIVYEADNISSSERVKKNEEEEIKTVGLRSIFDLVYAEKEERKNINRLRKLMLSEELYPVDSNSYSVEEGYSKLYDEFIKEFSEIVENSSEETLLLNVYYCLKKYLWCVPSDTYQNETDISLFEHLKITAAISVSMYKAIKEENEEIFKGAKKFNELSEIYNEEGRSKKRYVLLCGDISGIQNFIYNISYKGAAKGLKGRSFLIKLIEEAVAKYFLDSFELPITNLIYCSGGKFYILLPNIKEIGAKIEKITEEVNEYFLKQLRGRIYIGVGYEKLEANDFTGKKIVEKFESIIRKSSEIKKNKFKKQIINEYERFFEGFDKGGLTEKCEICGCEVEEVKNTEEVIKCEVCSQIEEIGRQLKKAKYLVFSYDTKFNNYKSSWTFQFGQRKYNYYLIEDIQQIKNIEGSEIYIINPEEENKEVKKLLKENVIGFKFIGGTEVSEDLTFEELCENNLNRMGILRMDVDNLGELFSKGLGAKETLARVSQLSFSLDLYFSGLLNLLISNYTKNKLAYIIYSGGDDLFIIGKWDIIPEIGIKINEDFSNYHKNKKISLSGGIYLIKSKFPIYKGAELAGEAEEKSKKYEIRDKKKSAITFLSQSMNWSDFKKINERKEELVASINNKIITKGFLNKLNMIYSIYKRYLELNAKKIKDKKTLQEIAYYSNWQWKLVYYFEKYKKENSKAEKLIKEYENFIFERGGDEILEEPIALIGILTRWSELELRK